MRIAVNGFGRIGRIFLRRIILNPAIEVVAINDLSDTETLAHLFKYDSVHRTFNGTVSSDTRNLYINGKQIKVLSEIKTNQNGNDRNPHLRGLLLPKLKFVHTSVGHVVMYPPSLDEKPCRWQQNPCTHNERTGFGRVRYSKKGDQNRDDG